MVVLTYPTCISCLKGVIFYSRFCFSRLPKVDMNSGQEKSWTTRNDLRRRIILSLMFLCISYAKSSNFPSTVPDKRDGSELHPTNCTKPAIEEFPKDFFTQAQRMNGGVVVHFLIALYLILSLGTICDDYFVPVLEILCEKLNLKPDVAGATFMAAGTLIF